MGAYEELDKFQTEEGRKAVADFVAAALAEQAADTAGSPEEPAPATPWWELSGMERELAKYDQCEEPGDCDHDHDNAIEYFRQRELNELRERAEKAEAAVAQLLEEKAAAFVDATTMFKGLTIRDGQAHLEIEPAREMILIWCASVRAMLDEHQAKNYTETELEMPRQNSVSLDIQDGQRPTDSYTLTLQRRHGKTPHQLRQQAERERDEARELACISLDILRDVSDQPMRELYGVNDMDEMPEWFTRYGKAATKQ